MTPDQLELLAKSIHDAYQNFHVNRYKVDFHPWEDTSLLERQMYREMAEGAFKAVKDMEGGTWQHLKALLQGYRDLTAFGRVTPILQEGSTMNVDWFAEYHALEAQAKELLEEEKP
jgi:hypothetical protein